MVSTMEAIYFAAVEAAVAKEWSAEERQLLVHLMWLFALQRRAIIRQQQEPSTGKDDNPLPFSEEGKDKQRNDRIRRPNKNNTEEITTKSLGILSLD